MPQDKYYKGKVFLLYVSHLSKQTFVSETASDCSDGTTLGQIWAAGQGNRHVQRGYASWRLPGQLSKKKLQRTEWTLYCVRACWEAGVYP